jgi:hypothetical protein
MRGAEVLHSGRCHATALLIRISMLPGACPQIPQARPFTRRSMKRIHAAMRTASLAKGAQPVNQKID